MDGEDKEKASAETIMLSTETEENSESPYKPQAFLSQPYPFSRMRVGSLLRTWADVSRINYMSAEPLDVILSGQSIRRRSIGVFSKHYSFECFVPMELRHKSAEDLFSEQFPVNVTPLMNEEQLWRCFYVFPELYADIYSPVVHVRDIADVPELIGGVLTRDMVTACLTYLARTPILGDWVYIKLDLSSKHLINIDVLKHYKFLVYLDLSSNFLTQLNVLSFLPYLQYLSVAFNRLETVLEYDTPQWFLTEVHYKFNSVTKIRDLDAFWSVTILDLSHNNIKHITGLETLRYLRRLDLSFNHIQRLENLNNLRLLWLDVSYNNISSFEFSHQKGLFTLLHLEYLNLNENNLTSLKIFSGCTRLRELHARNNRLGTLLELAVYMRQMRRLIVLDLRANPICASPGYMDVVINTFPALLSLDAQELDPIVQRTSKMDMMPDATSFATRRLLRLLYIEQLSKAIVSPHIPPADTNEIPLVVLVGYEAVGKGKLARRLAAECPSNIELALQHTTANFHHPEHYIQVSRSKFDDMLLAGELLTYSEMTGESYGLSREQAFINDSKVKIVTMDLIAGLMLRLRGRRPYLILATCSDKETLRARQKQRKSFREVAFKRIAMETPFEKSTLQVLLSGRIIITGILNEILVGLQDEKEQSEFLIESECSLMMSSDAREAVADYARGVNMFNLLISSSSSLDEEFKRRSSQLDPSLHSLYKESQGHDEFNSFATEQNSYQDSNKDHNKSDQNKNIKLAGEKHRGKSRSKQEKALSISRPKSVDFSRYASSTWKGLSTQCPDSTKSSKSVTFTSNNTEAPNQISGMIIEPPPPKEGGQTNVRSISTRPLRGSHTQRPYNAAGDSLDDTDLWLAFLAETGLLHSAVSLHSDIAVHTTTAKESRIDDPDLILKELEHYQKESNQILNTDSMRDEYETMHRSSPGLFWDTVEMDDPEEAFCKVKRIIKDIVTRQPNLSPMFDIDFASMTNCHVIQKKLIKIRDQIAPQRLFY
ncbi:uncharacterized protein LOC128675477 [Plodia interpunctella]|uniref:uncharacterized protein LOC128675477 n=1 Tax=Plodia interpunctella TaxID=58824 RepID=UPI002367BD62|nr:uncharacterized protein LOC128675477 [Plodia interpunctella]